MLYHPLDLTGVVYVVLLGIFGAVGELGNEIRDIEKDRHVRKNTFVLIGERSAFLLTLGLLAAALAVITLFALVTPGFFWLLPFVPFGLLLLHPVYRAMSEPEYCKTFVDVINFRAIVLAAIMLLAFGYGRLNGWF